MQKDSAEKWVTFTQQETYFTFNIHQVSKLENQLRKQGIYYRTIFYMNNIPVAYDVDLGYVEMSKDEEIRIINEAERGEQNGTSEC